MMQQQKLKIEKTTMRNLDKDFHNYFPSLNFELKDFQKRAVESVLSKDNTLCIMPTGGGKSLIYWLSALECGGISLIISPLKALIDEQANKLKQLGFETLVLHSDVKKQMDILTKFANKELNPTFVFVSPERIATDGYFEFCIRRRKNEIKLMVIDEIHCVSQWGISFRPMYKRIPVFLNNVFGIGSWCKILGLTATVNQYEIKDICSDFKITNILKDKVLLRSEIDITVKKYVKEDEKEEDFWKIIEKHKEEKILVYVYRKERTRGVEDLNAKASQKGYNSAFFHADVDFKTKNEIVNKFRNGDINIIFATNAFGMGIDIPDIRVVIHFMIPESAEQFYQEIGRAARDYNSAKSYLLYTAKNISVKENFFIDKSFPTENELRKFYADNASKKGLKTMDYFDNDSFAKCFHYFLDAGLIEIVSKGFTDIVDLEHIDDEELNDYYNSTINKGFIKTVKKCNLLPKQFADKVYNAILNGKTKLKKGKELKKCLVVNITDDTIPDDKMQMILKQIEDNKQYKHELLDYFVNLLDVCNNSQELHQQIALYLGMDKFNLNCIYQTVDGNRVRSKSEVIICDLLAKEGIKYSYEKKLYYKDSNYILPDFTIYSDNGEIYWEHFGMVGVEEYDEKMQKKLHIYNDFFKGKLITTYESCAISRDAQEMINKIKAKNKQ